MNRLKYFFLSLLLSVLILQSCSVQKRRYTSGYHLQWNENKTTLLNKESEDIVKNKRKNSEVKDIERVKENIISNVNFTSLTASLEKRKGMFLLPPDSTNCDTLIMRDGTEIKVKVIEITPTEIKYKFCNRIDGPTYVAYRYTASYIKYANGTLDSFVKEHSPATTVVKNNNNRTIVTSPQNQDIEKYRKEWYVRKKSVASIVFGACGLIPFYGAPSAVVAIIYGAKCLSLINKDPNSLYMYKRKAIIGLTLGCFALLAYLLLIVYGILVLFNII